MIEHGHQIPRARVSAAALGFDKLANVGVLYPGLQTLGGGAVLTGLVLAAIGGNVIDKKFVLPRPSRSPARC